MTGRRVAVVGAGMTRFVRRAQETGKELAWEASREALASTVTGKGPSRSGGPSTGSAPRQPVRCPGDP